MVADLLFYGNESQLNVDKYLRRIQKMTSKGQNTDYLNLQIIPGVTLEHYGVYENNELFDKKEDKYLWSTIFYNDKSHKLPFGVFTLKTGHLFRELAQEEKYVDLKTQLKEIKRKLTLAKSEVEELLNSMENSEGNHKKRISQLIKQYRFQSEEELKESLQRYENILQKRLEQIDIP
jgi:uncharacterized protein YdaT